MSDEQDESTPRGWSRRELLKRAGLAGAVVAVPVKLFVRGAAAPSDAAAAAQTTAAAAGPAFETLTAPEAQTLTAIVARLIPTDENGPGAIEAGALQYIDRALGGALSSSRQAYGAGLAALDTYSLASRGARFTQLSTTDQDSVLIDVETGAATPGIFAGSSAAFFAMVRSHTIQGTFGDPFYGGNRNFVGWDLIGYPGVRTLVTPDDQKLGSKPAPNHKSAYDYEMFNKATARVESHGEEKHGD